MSKECKEWFKVSEIAELLGFSKVSVYNKIKTLNSETLQCLQTLQKKEKGITYYKFEAFEIIKAAFSQDDNIQKEVASDAAAEVEDFEERFNYEFEYIQELKSQIEFMKEQLKIKDDLVLKHVKLVENEQILRREEKNRYVLMDEERARKVDEKLQAWRKEQYEKSDKEDEGFFKRLFRKKM